MFELLDSLIWIVKQIFYFWLTLVYLALFFGMALAAAVFLKGGVLKRASDTRMGKT